MLFYAAVLSIPVFHLSIANFVAANCECDVCC